MVPASIPIRRSIQVLVVEDDPKPRVWLEKVFSTNPGFVCLGAHATAEQAEVQILRQRPHLVLLDLELPGQSGVAWLETVNRRWPDLPVLVHTAYDEPARIFGALEAGASGYLVKPVREARLLDAITEAHEGGAPMTPAIARLVLRRLQGQAKTRRQIEGLTSRENEILRLISEGFLPEEVAGSLGISARTVSTHLQHVYRKLHVATRAQAVAKYLGNPESARMSDPQSPPPPPD